MRTTIVRAIVAFAKHFGLVTERLEMSGWDKLTAQLNHARAATDRVDMKARPHCLDGPTGSSRSTGVVRFDAITSATGPRLRGGEGRM